MRPDDRLRTYAHAMRRNPTEPEKRLWRHLSNSQLGGFKFRRQATLAPFVADFLGPAKALIVEVDGETHAGGMDDRRDRTLAARGFRTLRFTNMEVMRNMEGALATILAALHDQPDRWPGGGHHPNPSSDEEGPGTDASSTPSLGVARQRHR